MTTRYLGAPIARNEDRRLLTGRALFVNDVERPGMLHVAFLRSPHAHAKLGAVDLSRVRERRVWLPLTPPMISAVDGAATELLRASTEGSNASAVANRPSLELITPHIGCCRSGRARQAASRPANIILTFCAFSAASGASPRCSYGPQLLSRAPRSASVPHACRRVDPPPATMHRHA